MSSTDNYSSGIKSFYDREYVGQDYAPALRPEDHRAYPQLKAFVDEFGLHGRKCLEVGCGRGAFQDVVDDYTGVDLSDTVATYLHKPFKCASATNLPFESNYFDAAWTIWVLEHVQEPEKAFAELRRVLKPGGLLILWPAWQCRSWAANGYPVRPYSELDWQGKLIKATIPVRNSLVWRLLTLLPKRVWREACALIFQPTHFVYRRLRPNFEKFWMSDSDAINSMDPHEAILWFVSRGDECVNYPTVWRRLAVRTGPVVLRICRTKT